MKLYYYSHRYFDEDPSICKTNLERAQQRLEELRPVYASRGIHLWAPWLDLAVASVPLDEVWHHIEASMLISDGVLVDLDGAPESPGMLRELGMGRRMGLELEVIDIADFEVTEAEA